MLLSINVVSDAMEVVKPWTSICGILLTQSHKEALKSPNQWLDDDLSNATQYLLKKKPIYLWISVYYSTILSFTFQMKPKRTPFIQILNINNNNWITISTNPLVYDHLQSKCMIETMGNCLIMSKS